MLMVVENCIGPDKIRLIVFPPLATNDAIIPAKFGIMDRPLLGHKFHFAAISNATECFYGNFSNHPAIR